MPDVKKLLLLADDIFGIIKAMYDRFAEVKAGHVDADTVRSELARFKSTLARNDSEADAELAKRFNVPPK